MAQYDEVYQQWFALSRDERVNLCQNATLELLQFFKDQGILDDEDGQRFAITFLNTLIGLAVSADWKITADEAALYNAVFSTEYTPQDLAKLLAETRQSSENIEILDKIVDAMDEEHKTLCIYIVLTIASADGEISEEEEALLMKLAA